jgi:hypothetical protein
MATSLSRVAFRGTVHEALKALEAADILARDIARRLAARRS